MASAPSSAEVEHWLTRIDDVTAAVKEILQEQPGDAENLRKEREQRRQEQMAEAQKRKDRQRKERYNTNYYAKYEKDEVIEEMLREVDEPNNKNQQSASHKDKYRMEIHQVDTHLCYSQAERVSLEEAFRLKEEAAKAVQTNLWEKALTCYTNAIQLNVVDEKLVTVLHNNRALAYIKLHRYDDAINDTTFVLQREPKNVKALLRRATALCALYKPFDALHDVCVALRYEPRNPEALQQRALLQRVEEDLKASATFMVGSSDDSGQNSCAAQLRDATEQLSLASQRLWGAQNDGPRLLGDEQSAILASLQVCCDVVRKGGRGAAVRFALCGGVASVVRLTLLGQASQDTYGWLTKPCLFLLSHALSDCEIATKEVPRPQIQQLIYNLLDDLTMVQKTDNSSYEEASVIHAPLLCLAALTPMYDDILVAGLTGRHPTLLHVLWENIQRCCDSKDATSSTATCRYHADVHAFATLLEALVTLLQRRQAQTTGREMSEVTAVLALRRQLVDPTEGVCRVPLAVRTTECALSFISPRALQCRGAALALALTVLCTASSASSPVADVNVIGALLAPAFTSSLRRTLTLLLAQPNQLNSQDNLLLEALYSLIYNLLLQAPLGEAYATQWHECESRSLAVQSLDLLFAQLADAAVVKPMHAKLLGFASKSSRAAWRSTDNLSLQLATRAEGLWKCAAIALDVFPPYATCLGDDVTQESDSETSRTLRGGCAWECLEHVTTLLAFLHRQQVSVLNYSGAADQLMILLRVVGAARPPCRDVIDCMTITTSLASSAASARTTAANATAQIVAMGNAALLFTAVLDFVLRASGVPDSSCAVSRATVEARLAQNQAMDTVLQALRSTRASLMLLRHEQAEQLCTTALGIHTQLQRWQAHCVVAQQNLAIAVTKLCAFGDAQRARLRELNGFATLAAIQQQEKQR